MLGAICLPGCLQARRPPEVWEEAGRGRMLPLCSVLQGSKTREVPGVGREPFNFPVTELAGVADALNSGSKICLNYLYCA